jgi:ubiquinone/menaquinone biosynthesis C-methylase UbiE
MYDKLACIYDNLINEDVDYEKMVSWLDERIKKVNPAAREILEVGCGTGNVAIPLSKIGYDVTGMDISEEMLSVADEKSFCEHASVKWVKGDVCSIVLGMKFDVAIACLDTINYITDEYSLQTAFKNIYDSLKKNGVFVFDINTVYRLKEVYADNSFNYISEDLCYIWNCFYDSKNDTSEFEIDFFVKSEHSDLYERFDEVHVQKAYNWEKLTNMLLDVGFERVEVYEFLSETLPSSTSEKVALVAVRN